jgi:hypothetical protein
MGFSLEDLTKGVADVGKIIQTSTDTWNKVSGKTTTATPTITQPASPAAAGSSGGTVNQSSSGLASVPPWLLLGGGILLVLALGKRGR